MVVRKATALNGGGCTLTSARGVLEAVYTDSEGGEVQASVWGKRGEQARDS